MHSKIQSSENPAAVQYMVGKEIGDWTEGVAHRSSATQEQEHEHEQDQKHKQEHKHKHKQEHEQEQGQKHK